MAERRARAFEYLAAFVLVFLLWFLTWTWPVWPWCLGTLLGAWLVHRLRLRLQLSESSAWGVNLLWAMSKEGRDALLAIAFGCFLITVSQFVLRLCNAFLKDQAVRRSEYALSDAQRGLGYLLSLRVLAITLTATVLLSVIFPRLRLTRWFLDRKKLLSKALVALTAAVSFTFFGSAALQDGERQWTASRRAEFAQAVTRIGEARRQLIAAESVKRAVAGSPIGFRTDLRTFLTEAAERPEAEIIAEGAAERLGRQAPVLREADKDKDQDKKESMLDGIIEDVSLWSGGRSSGYQPSLSDLEFLAKTGDRVDAGVKEAHQAVADVIKTAAGGLLPAHTESFVRLFAKSLVGAVARDSVSSVLPRNVSDLRTASLWLDLAASEPRAAPTDFSTRPEWRISLRSPETFMMRPEAAVAIEIRMAKSEGDERRKREAEAQEARRLEIKRANEEYRAREASRRAAESYRESFRAEPRGIP